MTAKETQYRDKRIALLRSIIFLSEDLLLGLKKSQLRFLDLVFLKKTERQLITYHDLLKLNPKESQKLGVSSE